MLQRQKALLALLERLGRPISLTTVVKLAFLMREETEIAQRSAFYDFVPYRFGPFSFTMYRELRMLERDGYIDVTARSVAIRAATRSLAQEKAGELGPQTRDEIATVATRYGTVSHDGLLRDIYRRYPWYASRTEAEKYLPEPVEPQPLGPIAIYTIGYEGKSIDALLNLLLQRGIHTLIDVRANPVSRSYGFSHSSLKDICTSLDIDYRLEKELGIPSLRRRTLSEGTSKADLFDDYEETRLPAALERVVEVSEIMADRPSVLLCLETKPDDCHRSRLAKVIAESTGLAVVHL